jgi:hypothetical protein
MTITEDLIENLRYYRERCIKLEKENKILTAIIEGSQKLCRKDYQSFTVEHKKQGPRIIKMDSMMIQAANTDHVNLNNYYPSENDSKSPE